MNFSNELAPVLLHVYDSWGRLGNLGVQTSITRIVFVIYKKAIEKMLQTTDQYTVILKNRQQKALDTIISEKRSLKNVKNIEQCYILFLLFVT